MKEERLATRGREGRSFRQREVQGSCMGGARQVEGSKTPVSRVGGMRGRRAPERRAGRPTVAGEGPQAL